MIRKPTTVMIVEDDEEMCRLLEEVLKEEQYAVVTAADGEEALNRFAQIEIDVLITDLMMPGIRGRELLVEVLRRRPNVPVIVITAFGSIESAVDLIKGGAYHYLSKPFRMEELLDAVAKAIAEKHLLTELDEMRAGLPTESTELIAHSVIMRDTLETVTRAAAADTPVLLLGESGTGKELLARHLHRQSPRAPGPFLGINCAAIPETLLESQLFGHRRGSFTDAREDRPGLFQECRGGTLFLDEIGDMPLSLQAKLLRVLQEHEVHPVGASTPVAVDVRIVAATHRNVQALIADGRFREDLFYRLHVIAVHIPPLRERMEDLLPLLAHLLEKHGKRLGKPHCRIAPETVERLRAYSWPGNVRELESVIERALVLGRDEVIGLDDLPQALLGTPQYAAPPGGQISMAELEKQHIMRTMRSVGGNKAAAARLLGMDRKTLYRKLESYRLGVDDRPTE